jgi:hypothetical protein
MFAFSLLRGQLEDEDADLKTRFERAVASRKEAIFDMIFTPGRSKQNVHVLTFWKLKLGEDLGFDFKFESGMGTLEQDPFFGEEGNAMEAFLIGFAPEIVITLLTDEINEKGSFLSRATEEINRKGDFRSAAAKYIYESEESESIKRTWCEMDDEEFLNITKVTRAFVEDYLLKMGILERAGDEAQNPII